MKIEYFKHKLWYYFLNNFLQKKLQWCLQTKTELPDISLILSANTAAIKNKNSFLKR